MPHNKQLNNLDCLAVTGKSQTSAYRIDLAIAWSIRQGLSLRLSCNDLTLGYYVVNTTQFMKGTVAKRLMFLNLDLEVWV